jgi:DNA polymerase-3 subunit beta
MLINCAKKEIERGILTAVRAVNPRSPLPILSNVKLKTEGTDRLVISSTDLEIRIDIKINIEVLTEGETTVPAKILADIITQLPDRDLVLELNKEKNIVKLRCGNSKYDMHAIPAEDFPVTPDMEEKKAIEISQRDLKGILKNAAIAAASEDESRTVLTGVLMAVDKNSILMVSTDGRRLAKVFNDVETGVKNSFNLIIPSRTVSEVSRILQDAENTVKMVVGDNQIFFVMSDMVIGSRIIEGKFPDYNQIIPKSFSHIFTADRGQFISALRRAMIMALEKDRDMPRLVKFRIENGIMTITSNTPEVGQAYEEMDLEGVSENTSLVIAFNGKYILDGLNNLSGEKVNICLSTPISPGLIKEEGDERFTYLVMPVRLREDLFQEA